MIWQIHDAEDPSIVTYLISHTRGGWIEGVYESRRAANYAYRFSCDDLSDLQRQANAKTPATGGVITFKMLQQRARENKEKKKG